MSFGHYSFSDSSGCSSRPETGAEWPGGAASVWNESDFGLPCFDVKSDGRSFVPGLVLVDASGLSDASERGAERAPASEYEKEIFEAGEDAFKKFPVFAEIGASSDVISRIGLYEYRHRTTGDWFQDRLLNLPESAVPNGTYGPYQVSKGAFLDAKKAYPDVLKDYHLDDLLDPKKAAVVVGAYLALRAEEFKQGEFRGQETIGHFYRQGDKDRALVLSYNPGAAKFRGNGDYDGRQRSDDVLEERLEQ